eukprot:COSAG04_NODE_1088_length_8335_cov_16.006071_2_plen_1430_part_00
MEGAGARRCFCLSKGRDAQLLNAAGANAQLRELQALRPVALSKRAKAEGVDEELVEEALDSADPKSALIDLILRFSDDEPPGKEEHDPELRSSELEAMRLKALQARAAAEGIDEDAVDDALEGDNPKAALVALLLEHAAKRASSSGGEDAMLTVAIVTAGGETAADALTTVLDHAMDALEQLSTASPRKSRKSILELMESVEDFSNSVDEDWCDGVSRCGPDRLDALVSLLVAVQGLQPDEVGAGCVPMVSSLLECMRDCGSVVVQCELVMTVDNGLDESVRLRALECVRELPPAGLGHVSESEASLFGALTNYLHSEGTLSCKEQLSCWLSVFVLGCRNGVSVVARVDVLDPLAAALDVSVASLGAAVASGSIGDALRVCSAAHLCRGLCHEAAYKSAPDVRAPFEKRFMQLAKSYLGGVVKKAFSADSSSRVFAEVAKLQVPDQDGEGASLGCGALFLLMYLCVVFPKTVEQCDTETLFGGALALLRCVCPSPLPAEWWVSTCAEVDVTSARLGVTMQFFGSCAKVLGQATLESASWLGPALAEAVHICKVNASAGLSARPTMNFYAVAYALILVETAARVESHAASLLDSGVLEALDYACVNDFSYIGISVSSYAAGALVALVGRNEGGKTLSRLTVDAVLDGFATFFDPAHWRYSNPAARVLPITRRVSTVAIADANKKVMLQHDTILDTLVAGLLLDDDNQRRGQDGADVLQEACAGVLHELTLYGPGATALRAHKPTMDALRVLAESGTKESRERAAGALFELDEEARSAKAKTVSETEPGASKPPPPHIMVSYNWDHQHVILRVVAWLQAHGCLVWVDTEQMKGSTVDAMALAVEGSEVMLIGVSRPYKESSNCRMEAQYGLQKKKAMIPLMMQEGYEADGWLGLLLGTSLWYALYGSTLESESAFEDRMSALAREIGSRGRADAVVAAAPTDEFPEPCPEHDGSAEVASLRTELEAMRVRALERRALSEGVSADAVDDAMDSDAPKTSLTTLIVELALSRGPADRVLSALSTGGEAAADAFAAVLEHAMDVLEQLSMSSPRKSRRTMRDLLDSVEELSDSVDEDWCDGVSRCSAERLEALASQLVAVQGLATDQAASDCVSLVSSLLDALRECGSVAVQCESVFSVDAGSDVPARLSALECVRGLSPAHLEAVDASEASLFGVLWDHVCGKHSELSCEERLSCWLSAFVLGCRNGVSVVARMDVMEPIVAALEESVVPLGVAVTSGDMDRELRAFSALLVSTGVVTSEGCLKCSHDVRAELEACSARNVKAYFGAISQAFNSGKVAKMIARADKLSLLSQGTDEDASVGCGAANMFFLIIPHPPILSRARLELCQRAHHLRRLEPCAAQLLPVSLVQLQRRRAVDLLGRRRFGDVRDLHHIAQPRVDIGHAPRLHPRRVACGGLRRLGRRCIDRPNLLRLN